MKKILYIFLLFGYKLIHAQAWYPVGIGVYNINGGGDVSSLGLYNNELYLSGNFTHSGALSTYGIARWNGSVFNKVDSGVGIPNKKWTKFS